MRFSLSKFYLPVALAGLVFAQGALSYREVETAEPEYEFSAYVEDPVLDTVIHDQFGYRKGWTEEEVLEISVADSLLNTGTVLLDDSQDEFVRPAALDSLVPPDSLLQIDTFFYKYYAAVKDSMCHKYIRDSLIAAGDSLDWPIIDSLYFADSLIVAKEKFEAWYNSLDPAARKNFDKEQLILRKLAKADSLSAAKDSIKAYKDSVRENTPRILETYVLPDSMLYKRIISWTHDQEFHNLQMRDTDEEVGLNYRFNDYPFLRKDVNASWLGVAGSPVQYYNFFNRKSEDGAFFYEAEEPWTYNPHTLPMYNTKTPYTELAYWGTLIAASKKESDNLHLMTTQNISPALNFTLGYDRFGGGGMLANETVKNKTTYMHVNYLGKKYLMHAGLIHNMVDRKENGGIQDNYFIRDTTVDAREIDVRLSSATSVIKKNTFFLDQQYRIPLDFLKKKKAAPDTLSASLADSLSVTAEVQEPAEDNTAAADSLMDGSLVTDTEEVPTAFIGHSTEYTSLWRNYTDALSKPSDMDFYQNSYYSPTTSFDSLSVRKFENKVFARLQPWTAESVVSNLDVGLGHKLLQYAVTDPKYLHVPSRHNWNATYLYAGAGGQFKSYVKWDALGHYTLLGDEFGDFDIEANAGLEVFPFRRAKTSPIRLKAHFETSLDEPEYYLQNIYTNHFKWNNDFSKISTTKVQGSLEIPRFNFKANVGYALLANNIYFDVNSLACQNDTPMSILSASLEENIRLGILHLDNRALFQLSSNEDVVPLPLVALNARYYIQFRLGTGEEKAMTMQIGANILYNTAWYAPSWNPALGVFYNQTELKYGNAPYFDAFVNVQWKRACIFLKLENAGQGWPLEKADYFSANHYIRTQRAFKIGIFWPFFTQPAKLDKIPGPDDDPSDFF